MRGSTNQNRLSTPIHQHSQEVWAYFVLIASAVTILMVLLNSPSVARAMIVFGFLLFVPGWSFIRILRMDNPIIEWTLAIALSLALNTLVAMILIYTNAWSAQLGVIVLVGISLIGSMINAKDEAVEELPEETSEPMPYLYNPRRRRKKRNVNGGGR